MAMSKQEIQASQSYRDQVSRCTNPNNKLYKHYGLKGLTVEYSKEEFMIWWLYNLKNFVGKTPTVSRIDHSKGYSFHNIRMEENSVNFKEMIVRNHVAINNKIRQGKRVYIYSKKFEHIATINSIGDAAIFFGIQRRTVQRQLRGDHKIMTSTNFILRGELI